MKRSLSCLILAAAGLLQAAEPTSIKPEWEVKLPPYAFYNSDEEARCKESFAWCRKQIEKARAELLGKQPLIPPNFPLATDRSVVVMTPQGQVAYSLIDDPADKPPTKAGDYLWMVEGWNSMSEIAGNGGARTSVETNWSRAMPPGPSRQLYGQTLLGRPSVAPDRCYFVEDFGLLLFLDELRTKNPGTLLVGVHFQGMIKGNGLCCIDAGTGKIKWKLGGQGFGKNAFGLDGSFVLGSPLFLSDRLYVINEKDKDLRLVVLDGKFPFPHRGIDPEGKEERKGILATVPLLTAPESVATDLTRRIHSLTVVASDKLLLCPTHLGALVAVNRDDHKIAWTAKYGNPEDKRFENFSSTWRVTAPLVAGELVLYAPPDAEAIFAFNLKDGSLAWKRERGKGILPAGVHNGNLIIVEGDAVVAVNAADGKEAWKVPFIGTLTGMGAFNGDRYFLPLGLGDKADEGSLQIIDLKQGKSAGLLKRPDKSGFGNLLVHKDKLISQTFEALNVYKLP